MDTLLLKLEAVTGKITGAGGDVGEGELSPSTQAYFDFYSASVQPFIDACNKVEGTKKLGAWTETAFKHVGKTLQAAQDCAKPEQGNFLKFLDPIVQIINSSGNVDNRSASFPQEKSYNEIIQSLSWVMMDGGKAFIIGQLEAADFYLNKVLVAAKDKEDAEKAAMREYVSTLKTMMTAMADYSHEFHKQGLLWKFQGADILTWKPGAAAPKKEGAKASAEERLAGCCARLEAFASKMGGVEEGEVPAKVTEYNEFYGASVQPFVDACNKLEATKKLGAWTETCFKHLGVLIAASFECKKPSTEELMAFLGPIVKVVEASSNPDSRAASFPQEKSFAEAIQAMNWVVMDMPRPFVAGQLDAADFYLNKVLTAARDKEDPDKTSMREYVKAMKAMITELAAYVGKNYKTGLEWKIKDGKALSSYGGAAAAAAPVEEKKEAPKKKAFAFKPKPAAAKVGKVETQRDKIYVEHFGKDQKEPVVVTIPPPAADEGPKVGVFVGQCKDCVVKIEGKAKVITLSGCEGVGLVFDECVTVVEMINSKKCQVQSLTSCGTFTLDKCDRMKVYLASGSYTEGCLVYTTQCSASNIYYPTPDGEDLVEYGIAEQILSTFVTGKEPRTAIVIPDAE